MAEAAEEAQDRSVLDGLFDVEVEALEAAGSDEVVKGGVEVLELVDFIDLSALYFPGSALCITFCVVYSRVRCTEFGKGLEGLFLRIPHPRLTARMSPSPLPPASP